MRPEPQIDFIYICQPMVTSLKPYRTTHTAPMSTTWKQVRAEIGNVRHAIRREYPTYAWPGGYPLYYITRDNGVLCPDCANRNLKLTLDRIDPQWSIEAVEINYEDDFLICDNCSTIIKPAYGTDEPAD